jgi:hypothetical protein
VNGKCKADPDAECPAGEYHNGTQCVGGHPPECAPGKEYVAGKCIAACPTGLKRVGKKCKDNEEHECDDGETKHPTKGCIPEGSGTGGIAQAFSDQATLAAQAAAAAALTSGLSAGEAMATQAVLGKFNTAYGSYTALIESRNDALQKQIESFSITVPEDDARDKMMDAQLAKPVQGSTAKIRVWGVTPA